MKIKIYNDLSDDLLGSTELSYKVQNSFQYHSLTTIPEPLQSLGIFNEPTDVPSNTSSSFGIAVGETLQGQITNGDGGDWYQVNLVAGQTYTFAVVGTGTNNLLDTYLNLRDSAGNIIAFDDDGGPLYSSQIHYTATTTGSYFIDAKGFGSTDVGQYGLSFTQGTRAHFDYSMGAGALDSNLAWTSMPGMGAIVTYGFRQSVPSYVTPGSATQTTFTQLSAAEISAVRSIMSLWSESSNISFTEVNPGGYTDDATILFSNYADASDGAGAFAYFPESTASTNSGGDVYLNTLGGINVNSVLQGSWSYHAIMHEVGHALGLAHPGDYNAAPGVAITYANNAQFIEDSDQYTQMSYFDETETGGQYGLDNTANENYAYTPLLFDIYAMQQIYGINYATRATDTVYGFNCTAGSSYDFSLTNLPALCIWDGNGTDTLDASGYSLAQTINLNAGSFSTIGNFSYSNNYQRANNVSIAIGAVIENAKGGTGNDTLIGNSVNNVLNGGAGSDTAIFTGVRAGAVISYASATNTFTVTTSAGGSDTVTNVETLKFDDQSVAAYLTIPAGNIDAEFYLAKYADLRTGFGTNQSSAIRHYVLNGYSEGRTVSNVGNDILNGSSFNDTLKAGAGNDTLKGLAGDDSLQGGAGLDIAFFAGVRANAIVSYASATNTFTVTTADGGSDTVTNVETFKFDDQSVAAYLTIPTGSIDAEFYLAKYADLRTAFGTDQSLAIQHYVLNGFTEGRTVSNAGNDILIGSSSDDTLNGGSGNDILNGGSGNDILIGGIGQDIFKFTTLGDTDRIRGFSVTDDTIQLENGVYTSLINTGILSASSFISGAGITAAADSDDFLIFNSSTGRLYYDEGGNTLGSTAAIQIATLGVGLALTNADFVII